MVAVRGILGQKKALATVDRLIDRGKRGQAILFTGPAGIGKFALALHTARRFLCLSRHVTSESTSGRNGQSACGTCFSCRSIARLNHPDLLLVFPFPNLAGESKRNTVFHFSNPSSSDAMFSEETQNEVQRFLEEKSADPYQIVAFKKKANIPVSVVKDLIKALTKRPAAGDRRAVVVCDIEQMAFGAADLFLKTVEEPPEDSLVILTTSKPHLLLPTLLSRTLRIALSPVAEELVRDYLEEKDVDGDVDFYVRYSFLSPGLALKAYSEDIRNQRDEMWQILSKFIKTRFLPETIEEIRRRYPFGGAYEDARNDFELLERLLRDIYVVKMGLETELVNIDIKNEIISCARSAPPAEILRKWSAALAKASRVHGVNNVFADTAFVGAFIEFDRAG